MLVIDAFVQYSWLGMLYRHGNKILADLERRTVLDQLFAELPAKNMAKLEIYTFGSAASHFSNPAIALSTTPEPPSPDFPVHLDRPATAPANQHVIGHIEHYANEYDVIPRWGVLHSICDIQNNRYAGSVFVRMNQSGHMFNQHVRAPLLNP